jgi:hypothetical protein
MRWTFRARAPATSRCYGPTIGGIGTTSHTRGSGRIVVQLARGQPRQHGVERERDFLARSQRLGIIRACNVKVIEYEIQIKGRKGAIQ